MDKWNNLPNEILDNVLKRLDRFDVRECSLVCRSWVSAAQRYHLKVLTPTTDNVLNNIKNIVSVYQSNSNLVSYKPSPVKLVKTVDCRYMTSQCNIDLMDELFPFVEYIHLSDKQDLYNKIYDLIMDGKLKNLKKIPVIEWNEKHLELVLKRKDKIKSLIIHREYMYKVLEKLHLLKNLHTLKLNYSTNNATNICLQSLLFNIPTNLKYIYFDCKPPSALILNSSTLDIDNIIPLTSVKCMEIYNSHQLLSSQDVLIYFMKKFPSLDRLRLTSETKDAFKLCEYTVPTVHDLTRFLIYLFEMNCLSSVYPIITNESTSEAVSNFLYYALKKGRNVQVELKISFVATSLWEETRNPTSATEYIVAYNAQRMKKKICVLEVAYKIFQEIFIFAPYTRLFEQISHIGLEKITIGDTNRYGPADSVGVCLNSVFSIFNRLKTLSLHNIKRVSCWKEYVSAGELLMSTTMESLYLNRCNVDTCIFPEISSKCPNLKLLEINGCVFTKNNNEKICLTRFYQRVVPIELPHSRLDHLRFIVPAKACYDDGEIDTHYAQIHGFIKLKTGNHKKTRYCKMTFQNGDGVFIEACSGSEYQSQVHEKECVIYDIYCESVTTLTVDVDEDVSKKYAASVKMVLVEEEEL